MDRRIRDHDRGRAAATDRICWWLWEEHSIISTNMNLFHVAGFRCWSSFTMLFVFEVMWCSIAWNEHNAQHLQRCNWLWWELSHALLLTCQRLIPMKIATTCLWRVGLWAFGLGPCAQQNINDLHLALGTKGRFFSTMNEANDLNP